MNSAIVTENVLFQLFKACTVVFSALLLLVLMGCYESETEQAPPPVAPPAELSIENDTLSVPLATAGEVSVLGNDSTSTGSALSISAYDSSTANGGIVSHNGDGVFTYTPLDAFEGTDSFTYTAMDPDGTTAMGTVTITVSIEVVPNGRSFYAANCAICHAAGSDDVTTAFGATDLSITSSVLRRDLSSFGGSYELMEVYNDVSQQNIDELKAYLLTL